MEALRTPEERFDRLPGFPWEPRYREWEGLRLAYVDEGEGAPVVLLHGEPTWSFVWRKVVARLLESGHRCIAPDLPGFGRSDKPVDDDWYSYARHTDAVATLLVDLDLHEVTLVMQDWGGPTGLRMATLEQPDRVARLVAMDTGIFTGRREMSEAWHRFAAFVERTPDLPIGRLVAGGCRRPPSPEVIAAYEAPFPDARHNAGARAFPRLIPQSPEAPGAAEGRAVAEALRGDTRPSLGMWGRLRPVLALEPMGRAVESLFATAAPLTVVEEAGHFLQEDQGDQISALVADWLPAVA
jgi:haloalkane dehalogenase